jgi:hypothetical protein
MKFRDTISQSRFEGVVEGVLTSNLSDGNI